MSNPKSKPPGSDDAALLTKLLAGDARASGLTLWQFSDIKANDDSTRQCGQCVQGVAMSVHGDLLLEVDAP